MGFEPTTLRVLEKPGIRMMDSRNVHDCITLGTLDFTGSEYWAPFSFFELSLVNFGSKI